MYPDSSGSTTKKNFFRVSSLKMGGLILTILLVYPTKIFLFVISYVYVVLIMCDRKMEKCNINHRNSFDHSMIRNHKKDNFTQQIFLESLMLKLKCGKFMEAHSTSAYPSQFLQRMAEHKSPLPYHPVKLFMFSFVYYHFIIIYYEHMYSFISCEANLRSTFFSSSFSSRLLQILKIFQLCYR